MAVANINLVTDLQEPIKVVYLPGNLFSMDSQANKINVKVFDGGEDATLSGTVSANIVLSDGSTVPATDGTISGNVASITLPAAAYLVPGIISVAVKLTSSSVVTTLAAFVATMYRTETDTVVDPGTIIPSIQTLIDNIDAAVASIPADYSSLWKSLAPAFSADASYVAGQYVTYDLTQIPDQPAKVYRFITSHTGNWSSSDVVAVDLGGELSALKSAFDASKYNSEFTDNLFSLMTTDFSSGSYLTYDLSKIGLYKSGNTRIYTKDYLPSVIGCKVNFNFSSDSYQYAIAFNDSVIITWKTGEGEYTPTANGLLNVWFKKADGSNVSESDIPTIISGMTIKYYPNNVYNGLNETNGRIDDISDAVLLEFKNLFDDSTVVSGGYYSSSGTVTEKTGSNYSTQEIPVKSGKTYTFSGMTGTAYLYCGAVAGNGTKYHVRRSTLTDNQYICPNDVSFIKVSLYNGSFGNDAMVVEGTTVPPEYLDYNEQIIKLKESAIYPAIESEKKCKIIYRSGHIDYDHFSNISDQEYLSIYIPTKTGYYEQTFAHCVNDGRFADNWRLSIGFKTNDSLQRQYNVIVHGEFELAVALPKTSADSRRGYMGGIAHGYEKTDTNGLTIFVDGAKKSISDLSSVVSFDRINIIEQSTLYDPDNTTESVAVHSREYVITKDGIRIIQSLKWLINNEITRCFMAMLPIAKTDNVDTSIVITDRFFSDVNAMPQTPDYSEGEQYIPDAQRVTMFSSDSNAMASLTCVEYPDNYVGGKTAFLTDNDGGAYNKLYFQISSSGGGNSVTAGTLWKSITEYVIRC